MRVGVRVSEHFRRDVVASLVLAATCVSCGEDSPRDRQALTPPDAGAATASEPADAASPGAPVEDVDVTGTWLGTLDVTPIPLRVVFNLERGADGGWSGTADSPDQGAFGTPLSSIDVTGARVVVRLDAAGFEFSGQMSSDGQSLVGLARQGGVSLPLTLERQSGPLDYRRPQDPVPPFPYDSADVTFPSDAPGVTLAGTLVWPAGPGPFPTVVLITGSGAQNRNEELLNHRPFLVLADALARANIAVLRYDDRGVGASTGDFAAATTPDFAADARGAVRFLRAQSSFSAGAIGLVGHSEGGIVAPLVADGNADVSFLVLLAGPAVTGEEIVIAQQRAIAAAEGASPAEIDAAEAQQRKSFACVEGPEQALDVLDACLRQALAGSGLSEEQLAPGLQQVESPWFRWFLKYDPAPVLRRTRVPLLALNGSLDLQVLASQNLPVLRAALEEAGNDRSTVDELPGLNHLFQHAMTGSPSEYGLIEETMAPEVLTQVAGWIGSLPPPAP